MEWWGKGPTRNDEVVKVDVSLGDQQSGLHEAHLDEVNRVSPGRGRRCGWSEP